MALILSVLFPGILFVASMARLFGCIKRRADGAVEYVWATGYSMVSCMSAVWLAASLASISAEGLSAERTQLMMSAGPQLFIALGLILMLRPVVRGVVQCARTVSRLLRKMLFRKKTKD